MALYNVADMSSFTREWRGSLAHARSWITGDAGNHHLITDTDKAATIPKGTYLLVVTPDWTAFADNT